MSDLQELWNSDREQLRQVRELLRKSEARISELEAEKAEHYEHARTATETALKTCIRARERQAAQIVDLNECLRVSIVDTAAAQTRIAQAVAELERIDPGGECTGNALAILKGEA